MSRITKIATVILLIVSVVWIALFGSGSVVAEIVTLLFLAQIILAAPGKKD